MNGPRQRTPLDRYLVPSWEPFQQGISGRIVSGTEKKTGLPVAFKIIDISNDSLREVYGRERHFLSKLRNKGEFVQLIDSFIIGNSGVLVMERKSFDLYDRSDSGFSLSSLRRILFQIAVCLRNLHRLGIAHLDVKPENVLVDNNDNVSLCDFGTAVEPYKKQLFFDCVGSHFYLSPEVLQAYYGYNAFPADVWSLGILFHVVISGTFPFQAASEEETLANYQRSKISLEELKRMNAPPKLVDLISKMLVVDTNERLSMQEVVQHPYFM